MPVAAASEPAREDWFNAWVIGSFSSVDSASRLAEQAEETLKSRALVLPTKADDQMLYRVIVLWEDDAQVSAEDIKAAGFERPWRTQVTPEQIDQAKPELVSTNRQVIKDLYEAQEINFYEPDPSPPELNESLKVGPAASDSWRQKPLETEDKPLGVESFGNVTCLGPDLCAGPDLQIFVEVPASTEAPQVDQGVIQFVSGASVWASQKPSDYRPKLAIRGPRFARVENGQLVHPIEFWTASNFSDQMAEWRLELHLDTRQMGRRHVATLEGDRLPIGYPIIWSDAQLLSGGEVDPVVQYELFVIDSLGREHKTVTASIDMLQTAGPEDERFPETQGDWYEAMLNENQLVGDAHVPGDLVTIHGRDLPAGGTLMVGSDQYPIGNAGRIEIERHLPPGSHSLPIRLLDKEDGDHGRADLSVAVENNYFFMVGIADFTTGENDVDGARRLIENDYHYDGDLYVDGRLAFFLKGQIKGRP